MTFSSRVRLFICLSALLAIAFLLSCGDDPCKVKDEADFSRDTPDNLINHLAESFEHQRLDWFSECLDEAFTFILTEEDADSLGLPVGAQWLDMGDDTAAVGRMFRDENVKDVSFSFTELGAPAPAGDAGTSTLRTVPNVRVETECAGRPPVVLLVAETYLDFVVGEDPDNEGLWVILSMEEVTMVPGLAAPDGRPEPAGGGYGATEPTTLGRVISVFLTAPTAKRTADEALEDYAGAIETEDIHLYGDCLDYYHRFVFTDDIADSLRLPPEAPWWNKPRDLEVMTAMFEHAYVTNIRFDYFVISRDTSWVKGARRIKIRTVPDIWLTSEAPGEEPMNFAVQDVYMDFELVGRGPCSDGWTVLSVEEIPWNPKHHGSAGMALTEASTWGALKAMFVQ